MSLHDLGVTVRLFSVAKDIAGYDVKQLRLPSGARASSVLDDLARSHPRFEVWLPSVRLAVNQEYVPNEHVLCDGDEVAVIPPVSGG